MKKVLLYPDNKKKYQLIYADCPWRYRNVNTGGSMTSGSAAKYKTMSLDKIKALPVPKMAAKNSILGLWATVLLLPEALEVMKHWGFKYKTKLTWRKIMSLGMGFWFRGQIEDLLIGIKGKVRAFRMQEINFYQSKSLGHSEKPAYYRNLIATAANKVFDNPERIEIFAKIHEDPNEYEGWDVFGDEI